MDEKIKAKELENDFNLVFEKTLTQLKRTYPRVSRVKKDADLDDNVFKIIKEFKRSTNRCYRSIN